MNDVLKFKNLPKHERPRERLLNKGATSLSDAELIAILLSKGTKKASVNLLAQNLLSQYKNLKSLVSLSPSELQQIEGIGLAKAASLIACFEIAIRISSNTNINDKSISYTDAKSIYQIVKPYLAFKEKEILVLVSLDARYRLIAIDEISVGTINESLVHPREVFRTALLRQASSIILAHNHPSGDPEPSPQDLSTTKRLMQASYTIGIPIQDHIIVGDAVYLSLKDEEYISRAIH